ncbi:hypothetical protein [Plantactinospora sonchi]|uniref:Uncharacterized protein n=1 Tax=Plantactinospora sonchi TaxID=1544735 RepID=A0ABU7RRH5_9ACTN
MTAYPWQRELRTRCEAEFDFLVVEHGCRRRGRFCRGGFEIFYWNRTTGVRVTVEFREEFVVHLCPLPEGRFPPRVDEHGGRRRIEWYDAFDAVKLVTKRRPRFDQRQLFENHPAVIAAYADALRGPCQSLLRGEEEMWARLRRQIRARIGYWNKRWDGVDPVGGVVRRDRGRPPPQPHP